MDLTVNPHSAAHELFTFFHVQKKQVHIDPYLSRRMPLSKELKGDFLPADKKLLSARNAL